MTSLAGTPDYNTSPLQDTRILSTGTYNLVSASQQTLGPFYVQQISHIFVSCTPTNAVACRLVIYFDYYADAALSKLIDTKSYVFSNNRNFQQMVPILGAYLVVRAQSNIAGGNSTTITLVADSRGDAAALFNRGREIGPLVPVSLAAGANQTVDMLSTIGGPGFLYWEFTGTAYALSIWTLDFGGNTRFLVHVGNSTAPATRWINLVWPPGLMQLYTSNSDATAQTMHVIAVLS